MKPKKYAVVVKMHDQPRSESFLCDDVYHDRPTSTLELSGVAVRGGTGRMTFNMRYVESYSVVEVRE